MIEEQVSDKVLPNGKVEGPEPEPPDSVEQKQPEPDPLNRIPVLFHFTDRRNLDLIRKLGGLYPMSALREMKVEVPAPGGNEWSRQADGLKGIDEYVHLCFRNNHPMEFRAREEGRIKDSIFLQVHPEVLRWKDVKFTPDVANKAGVVTYTIEEARRLIDFEVLYTWTDWNKQEIKQRLQQAEKAEILVAQFIPVKLIRNLPNG